MTLGWQGERPYVRRYERELVSKPVRSRQRKIREATVERHIGAILPYVACVCDLSAEGVAQHQK